MRGAAPGARLLFLPKGLGELRMRWRVWVAFAVLCLLSSSEGLVPAPSSGVGGQGLVLGVAGLVSALLGPGSWRLSLRRMSLLAVAGLGFFAAPVVFFGWAAGSLAEATRVAGLAGVPVIVVMIESLSEDGVRRLLLPALVGLGGILLLMPVEMPAELAGWVGFVGLILIVVLVGVLSVVLNRLLQGVGIAEALAAVCLPSGMVLLICGWWGRGLSGMFAGWGEVGALFFFRDAVEVVLVVWLLRAMRPVRFAARYFLIPLLIVVEGWIVWRPGLTARMGFGIGLAFTGAVTLLLMRCGGEGEGLSLR